MSNDISQLAHKKIAIVYDWIDSWGGVERVLLTLHEIFPHALFYTSYFNPRTASWAKNLALRISFIQKFPSFIKNNRVLSTPLYPYAFESFDLSSYDIVISISSSFAKSVITKPSTLHIDYVLTPPRYLWTHTSDYISSPFMKKVTMPLLTSLRKWDMIASSRPDRYIAISDTVKKRVKKYYGQDASVIYPPFDETYWTNIKTSLDTPSTKKSFFLVVSRLESYKKIELAISACQQLNTSLVIIGEGRERKKLEKYSSTHVKFLGHVSDHQLGRLYQNAQALIMTQEEDFGYTALEAQFFGCPVIAYRKGGTTETVLEGKTGIFFDEQTSENLQKAIATFHTMSYTLHCTTHELGPSHIKKFSKEQFIQQFINQIKTHF